MELMKYNGNFVKCEEQIETAKQKKATARQGMQDRIALGLNSHYKSEGCWHPEGTARIESLNYWYLQQFAPTTHYSQETLEANKNGKYLSLTEEIKLGKKPASQLIKEIADAENYVKIPDYKKRILIPKNQQTFSVASDSLGDVDIAVFLARSQNLAEQYGNFLKEKCGIDNVTFYQISKNYDNVAAGFWLHGLERGDDSGFGGYNRAFDYADGSLFGVAKRKALSQRKSSAKPTQKILAYKPSDLKNAKKNLSELLIFLNKLK